MFPTKFVNDAKNTVGSHQCIQFHPTLPNKAVIEGILEKGISGFIKTLSGVTTYQRVGSGCCSFSKNNGAFYLYPITDYELANVGLVEEDLVEWIKYLNDMEVGFDYAYFGNHPFPSEMVERLKDNLSNNHYNSLYKSKGVYWVGVPRTDAADSLGGNFDSTNYNVPYLKWIALRYLINTSNSTNLFGILSPKADRLAYYNIPRITLFLNKELKVPKLRAFLYAHVAAPFYSYYGLAFTDFMGYCDRKIGGDYSQYQAPCVHMTADQFKNIWLLRTYGSNMNGMLTQSNFAHIAKAKIEGLVNLSAPYDYKVLHELFQNKDYEGFVKHIKESYKTIESNVRGGKKKLVTSKIKTNVRKKVLA